ncbi:FAD-dependent oxidoreductase [Streptomyces sp. CS227]|uniref:FAD-dependent oxidoreductase n=1 Tax=Streptomyces sp. CS227 TaxID=1982763 RepID=UPI00211AB0F3|nr:FAD-binding oxidoreductase [Streptomyces sp. CS227]
MIGGGVGGLTAALMLGRRGHRVTVFEQDARRARDDPTATAPDSPTCAAGTGSGSTGRVSPGG